MAVFKGKEKKREREGDKPRSRRVKKVAGYLKMNASLQMTQNWVYTVYQFTRRFVVTRVSTQQSDVIGMVTLV